MVIVIVFESSLIVSLVVRDEHQDKDYFQRLDFVHNEILRDLKELEIPFNTTLLRQSIYVWHNLPFDPPVIHWYS